MKKSLIILLGAALLGILGFVWHKAGEFNQGEHAAFQTTLWQFKRLDTTFNENIFEARFGLLNNYDDFQAYQISQQENLAALDKLPPFLTPEGRAAIQKAKNEYLALLQQRNDLLEQFKSKNAILSNSRRYFPVAVGQLADRLGNDPDSQQLSSLISQVMQSILAVLSNPDASSDDVEARLSKLTEWCKSHPQHPESRFALSLVRHARVIATEKTSLDALIRKLVALPTEDAIQKVSLAYDTDVADALNRTRYYRLILILLSVAVIGGIGYTLWALRAANRNLEARVAERTRELASSEQRFRTLCLSTPIGIQMMDSRGLCTYTNPAWTNISGLNAETCLGHGWISAVHPADREQVRAEWDAAVNNRGVFSREYRLIPRGETTPWVWSQAAVIRTADGAIAGFVSTLMDITGRKEADAKLEIAHRKIVETSHQAGMAEVATNVLHNVGNVLNSVNVSATVIGDRLKASKITSVAQVADLFRKQGDGLAAFLTTDPKGKQLPDYINRLAEHLAREQAQLIAETDSVRKNIEHIKDIVAMQQNYAKISGVVEKVKVADLVEDALRMNAGALTRHDVELVRDYAPHVSDITVEKHKILQVLVNLIRNAKYACDESGRLDKKLTMRLANGGESVRISVIDNGIGIPEENMTKIFRHGFTTRKEGHGFGLHGAALAAKQMGGALIVHSDGHNRGATFTLELPLTAPENE